MAAKISVFTSDDFLYRKIALDAPQDSVMLRGVEEADILLVDIDNSPSPSCAHITMSRHGTADIAIPFRLGTIKSLTESPELKKSPLTIHKEERCAYLRGERIKLTELEFALFSLLYRRGGEFAMRDEILREVWGEGVDPGILNVYIHYLREKLEAHGEKIIISSRKCGYKIDSKYFGGEADA